MVWADVSNSWRFVQVEINTNKIIHSLGFWALGLAIGPIIGGAVVHGTTWRWIFYLMFPFLAFGLVSVPYLLTLNPRKATINEKLARIDWVGSSIFTGSATSFLIAVSWGGSQVRMTFVR